MGLLDRIFGRTDRNTSRDGGTERYPPESHQPEPRSPDDQAIERYRYLLRTAPPEQVEAAHAEAFAQLTPEQRQQVLGQLAAAVPAGERPGGADPQSLARAATRAEMRRPGTLERAFGGGGMGAGGMAGRGPGFGSMVGAGLLGTVAGVVVGSAVADAFFGNDAGDGGGGEAASADGGEGDASGEGGDASADGGGGDFGGGDFGGF